MNAYVITYTDGTSFVTGMNGTLEEVRKYFRQFGGVRVDENPVTGAESFRYIQTVEPLAEVGQIYVFPYEQQHCSFIVTRVTAEHIYYKFNDRTAPGLLAFEKSFPMHVGVWYINPDQRKLIGTTDDPDALIFIQ